MASHGPIMATVLIWQPPQSGNHPLRYSSRPPTALELSVDLQKEPDTSLAVVSGRTFVGQPSEIANAADGIVSKLVLQQPTITLSGDSLNSFGPTDGTSP